MNNNEGINDSLSQVKSLLARNQLFETLVLKQNNVELQKVLDQLAPGPIARILEELSADDRQIPIKTRADLAQAKPIWCLPRKNNWPGQVKFSALNCLTRVN